MSLPWRYLVTAMLWLAYAGWDFYWNRRIWGHGVAWQRVAALVVCSVVAAMLLALTSAAGWPEAMQVAVPALGATLAYHGVDELIARWRS